MHAINYITFLSNRHSKIVSGIGNRVAFRRIDCSLFNRVTHDERTCSSVFDARCSSWPLCDQAMPWCYRLYTARGRGDSPLYLFHQDCAECLDGDGNFLLQPIANRQRERRSCRYQCRQSRFRSSPPTIWASHSRKSKTFRCRKLRSLSLAKQWGWGSSLGLLSDNFTLNGPFHPSRYRIVERGIGCYGEGELGFVRRVGNGVGVGIALFPRLTLERSIESKGFRRVVIVIKRDDCVSPRFECLGHHNESFAHIGRVGRVAVQGNLLAPSVVEKFKPSA